MRIYIGFSIAFLPSLTTAQKIYLIPPAVTNSSSALTTQGLSRAECLRSVFGRSSPYNIGYIIAQTPKGPFPSLLPEIKLTLGRHARYSNALNCPTTGPRSQHSSGHLMCERRCGMCEKSYFRIFGERSGW